MPWPASARAPLLITTDVPARDPETDGEKEPLAPEPETDAEVLAARADPVPCPDELLGPFRAIPRAPEAACANDWDETPDIPWPASARAPLLITPDVPARDPETDGEKEPLAPAALTVFSEVELLAEADCEVASCGLLRAAFIPDAD